MQLGKASKNRASCSFFLASVELSRELIESLLCGWCRKARKPSQSMTELRKVLQQVFH